MTISRNITSRITLNSFSTTIREPPQLQIGSYLRSAKMFLATLRQQFERYPEKRFASSILQVRKSPIKRHWKDIIHISWQWRALGKTLKKCNNEKLCAAWSSKWSPCNTHFPWFCLLERLHKLSKLGKQFWCPWNCYCRQKEPQNWNFWMIVMSLINSLHYMTSVFPIPECIMCSHHTLNKMKRSDNIFQENLKKNYH